MNNHSQDAANRVRSFNPAALPLRVAASAAGGAAMGSFASGAWAGESISQSSAAGIDPVIDPVLDPSTVAVGGESVASSDVVVESGCEAGAHFVSDAAVGEATGFGIIGVILMCCGL